MNLIGGAILHCTASVLEPEDAEKVAFSVLSCESKKREGMDTEEASKERGRDKMVGRRDEKRDEGNGRRYFGAAVSPVPNGRDIPLLHLARRAEDV
jgi:hypothetical protein